MPFIKGNNLLKISAYWHYKNITNDFLDIVIYLLTAH